MFLCLLSNSALKHHAAAAAAAAVAGDDDAGRIVRTVRVYQKSPPVSQSAPTSLHFYCAPFDRR